MKPQPPPPNWDVLIRVLDQPEIPEPRDVDDLSMSEIQSVSAAVNISTCREVIFSENSQF